MTFREYIALRESKDHLINKLNMTPEQKERVIGLFRKYPHLESKIDWNRKDLTFEDFKPLLSNEGKSKTQAKKKGLKGLKEGKDYVVIDKTPEFTAYQPLTYLGSVTLASNRVPPAKGSGAQWCIAQHDTPVYWNKYTLYDGVKFVIVCTPETKFALVKYPEDKGGERECYSFEDSFMKVPPEFDYLLDKDLKDYPPLDVEDYVRTGMFTKEKDGSYSVLDSDKSLELIMNSVLNQLVQDGKFFIKFNRWVGDFICPTGILKSLEGCPKRVEGDFTCNYNDIEDLEGAPEYVEGSFNCSSNKLKSLKGCPREIGGGFFCTDNPLLVSLKGGPQKVGLSYVCSYNTLSNLEGAPSRIRRDFDCSYNSHLSNLQGSPEYVDGDFYCDNCGLESLEGSPETVRGSFFCEYNNLTSLEGFPDYVGGNFYLSYNDPDLNEPQYKISRPKGLEGGLII